MSKGRYEITVKRSRKIVERHYFDDYGVCMGFLGFIEYKYTGKCVSILFKDHDPFAKSF